MERTCPASYSGHVEQTMNAVWFVPGEAPQLGLVVGRKSTTKLVVRWPDGREEIVGSKDPAVRFAPEGSLQLRWLLDPGALEERLREAPVSVFLDVLKDRREPLTAAKMQKPVVEAGMTPETVKAAWNEVKTRFKTHPNVAVVTSTFEWSDEPVDPHAALRRLSPEQALDRLLKPGLKPDEKKIVADIIRSGFK